MTSISDTEVVNAPGGYVELASTILSVDSSIVSAGSNAVVIGPITAICDGSPVLVEFQAPRVDTGSSGGGAYFVLEVDGVAQGRIGEQSAGNAANSFRVSARLTPSAGSRTFQIRMYPYTSAAAVRATSATWAVGSCYLRVSKIIQASQLLVTQSNAPIVTSLPSGNLVMGQEVDLYVTTPYVGYQRYKWNGSAWYMIADSRSTGAWQTWSPTITQGVNVTHNVARARYIINGKTVQMMMGSTITGTGTSGNAINISLPVTAFSGAGYMSGRTGTFHYYRSATGFRYTGILELNTTTTGVMVSEETGGNALGAAPSFSAGVNDQIAITATYEVD